MLPASTNGQTNVHTLIVHWPSKLQESLSKDCSQGHAKVEQSSFKTAQNLPIANIIIKGSFCLKLDAVSIGAKNMKLKFS